MEQRQAYLNGKARRLIYSTLEQKLRRRSDGTYQYADDWNDEVVTSHVRKKHPQAELKVGQVTGVRNRGWGSLYKEPIQTDAEIIAELKARIKALENSSKDCWDLPKTVDNSFDKLMGNCP